MLLISWSFINHRLLAKRIRHKKWFSMHYSSVLFVRVDYNVFTHTTSEAIHHWARKWLQESLISSNLTRRVRCHCLDGVDVRRCGRRCCCCRWLCQCRCLVSWWCCRCRSCCCSLMSIKASSHRWLLYGCFCVEQRVNWFTASLRLRPLGRLLTCTCIATRTQAHA